MNQLIKINTSSENITISGRELHQFLKVKTRYNDWFERMTEYGFTENEEYKAITQKK